MPELPPGFRFADEQPEPAVLPPGFRFADQAPTPRARPVEAPYVRDEGLSVTDTEPQLSAAEAAALRTRRSVRPPGGRQEGALTRTIEGTVPAVAQELDRLGKTSHDLLTGELPPAPENVLPAAMATVQPAARGAAAMARAGMGPRIEAQAAEIGVQLPRAATAGPVGQATGKVLSKVPYVGAPLREAAGRANEQLAEAVFKSTVRPTGQVVDQAAAGKIVREGLKEAQAAGEELPAKVSGMLKGHAREENTLAHVISLASSERRGDINALGRVRAAVTHRDWQDVQGAALVRLGRTPEGQFDPNAFLQNYRGLSPGGKNMLFGDSNRAGSLRYHLDSIDAVARRAPQWQQFEPTGFMSTWLGRRVGGSLMGTYMIHDPITTLGVIVPARRLAGYLSKPASAAAIAQWSRAYEGLARSGGTPATIAAFQMATRNLKNTTGENFTDTDLLKASVASNQQKVADEDLDTIGGVVRGTMKLAPKGVPWQKWQQSENVEDRRAVSGADIDRLMSGDRRGFDDFLRKYGLAATYNYIISQVNERKPIRQEVKDYINEVTEPYRKPRQEASLPVGPPPLSVPMPRAAPRRRR